MIQAAIDDLSGVNVLVYKPTRRYQNVAKRRGVEKLTPARAPQAMPVTNAMMPAMNHTSTQIV